jgi:ASC-1-like (ASCH) protein
LIKFTFDTRECLTRIRRVAACRSFEDMFDHENPAAIHPTADRTIQLANNRAIYQPGDEALGVLAIEIERVRPVPAEVPCNMRR